MPDYIVFNCIYIVLVTTNLWWPKCTVTWHTVYHKLVESILVIGTRPNYFVCSICPTKALNFINCNKDVVWNSLLLITFCWIAPGSIPVKAGMWPYLLILQIMQWFLVKTNRSENCGEGIGWVHGFVSAIHNFKDKKHKW